MRGVALRTVVASTMLLSACNCAPSPGVEGGACEKADDCAPGLWCIGRVCRQEPGWSHPGRFTDDRVDPGYVAMLELPISNVGRGVLSIIGVRLDVPDSGNSGYPIFGFETPPVSHPGRR